MKRSCRQTDPCTQEKIEIRALKYVAAQQSTVLDRLPSATNSSITWEELCQSTFLDRLGFLRYMLCDVAVRVSRQD